MPKATKPAPAKKASPKKPESKELVLTADQSRDMTVLRMMENKQLAEEVRTLLNPDLKDIQLRLFFHECARRNVHPLDKMIYPLIFDGRLVFVTSIDYLRSLAEESGEYAGQDEPALEWEDEKKNLLRSAKVTVYRWMRDARVGFTTTARYESYKRITAKGEIMKNWQKMPDVMLPKCAEALSLRKAFPKKIGSLYAFEEMDEMLFQREVKSPKPKSPEAPSAVADAEVVPAGDEIINGEEVVKIKGIVATKMNELKETMTQEAVSQEAKKILFSLGAESLAKLKKNKFTEAVQALESMGRNK